MISAAPSGQPLFYTLDTSRYLLHDPSSTLFFQVTEEEKHAAALARALEYLEGLGPEDGHLLTNDRVLEVMDLQETATTFKLLTLVIVMAGIHPDWRDKQLKDRFRSYLVQSATTLRPMLAAERDAPWLYLAKLGDLRQPALLLPKAPQSKVAKLLKKTLEKHGEGQQQCHACRRWGDLALCGCLAVTFCDAKCQEQDEEHARECQELEAENVVLLARSKLRHRQRANRLDGVARAKEMRIRRMREEMARRSEVTKKMTKKLVRARATLNLTRRVSLIEQSLTKVPRLKKGNNLVALSISKKEGVARLTPLPHPTLKLWQSQLEEKPDPPALPAPASALPAQVPEAVPAPDPEPAGAAQADPAPETALPGGPDRDAPAPCDALLPLAPETQPATNPNPAPGKKSLAKYARKDKGILLELSNSSRPFSKVMMNCQMFSS